MSALLTELKIRARLQRNGAPRSAAPGDSTVAVLSAPRLRDCLNQVAKDVGFSHWEHARRILGGFAGANDDQSAARRLESRQERGQQNGRPRRR